MTETSEKKSALRVVVHSFFVVPFLIAAFAVLVFFMWRLLTNEPRSVEDYLADVKVGSATKRWQSAYDLSRILADPARIPDDGRFVSQMLSAFDYSLRDPDWRVRQYLIRAMGQSGLEAFSPAIRGLLNDENETIVADAVYSLGLIGSDDNLEPLKSLADHNSSLVRNRVAIALGNLGSGEAVGTLCIMLRDMEPNVYWNAAVSLAKLGDGSGREVLLNLLDRTYLAKFEGLDGYEHREAMLVAIRAAELLDDSLLNAAIRRLSEDDQDMRVRNAAIQALRS
ncbi:MAG: HEAT repeat domain-containing protein [Candidatus Neomarinimicrobiota bacterium]